MAPDSKAPGGYASCYCGWKGRTTDVHDHKRQPELGQLRCPRCGDTQRLAIYRKVVSGDSDVHCNCGHWGIVDEFTEGSTYAP